MEISLIEAILLISVIINFLLIKNNSNKEINSSIFEKINYLESNLNNYKLKNEEHIENINFHNESLSKSIMYHLHASGIVNMNRIWKTYQAEVKEQWPHEEKKWPNYLPIEGNPERKTIEINEEEHNEWLAVAKIIKYHKRPNEIINYDYVYEMVNL